jgi:hypothetical protein
MFGCEGLTWKSEKCVRPGEAAPCGSWFFLSNLYLVDSTKKRCGLSRHGQQGFRIIYDETLQFRFCP